MYCVNCGVQLSDTEEKCPLCQTVCYHPQIQRQSTQSLYPAEKYPAPKNNAKGIVMMLTYAFILLAVVPVLCDLHINRTITWSGFVATALAMVYVILVLPFWFRNPSPAVFVPTSFVAVAGFLFYVDLYVAGEWFWTFALPVTGAICLIVTTLVVLLRYVKKGKLYIYGGCILALAAFMPVMELLLNLTFNRQNMTWSVYPFGALVAIGGYLIFLAVCRPAREVMERKFFI